MAMVIAVFAFELLGPLFIPSSGSLAWPRGCYGAEGAGGLIQTTAKKAQEEIKMVRARSCFDA